MPGSYEKCKTPFVTSKKLQILINLPTPWPMKNKLIFQLICKQKNISHFRIYLHWSCPAALLHQQYIKDIFPLTVHFRKIYLLWQMQCCAPVS